MKKLRIPFFLILFCFALANAYGQSSPAKPIVAVLDLQAVEVSESEARAVTNLLISVIHGTDLVQIIDRNQREEILNEISFSLSGCADDSCALEIGKMLAADILITGSLSKVGSRISIELKALSVEEGSILETTFKLFDSIDEVVDNIDSVGATLIQNVTGKRAAQREVLEYEDLVTLTVISETEDASVIVNDTPVGRIENGRVTKALNRNINVKIRLEHPGFYPAEKETYLDGDSEVSVSMEPRHPVSGALRAGSGGGTMGSFFYRWYPVPSILFSDFGLGVTVQPTSEFNLQSFLQLKAGCYFNNENNFLRPYGGVSLMYPFISYIQFADGNIESTLFGTNPNDWTQIPLGGDDFLGMFDFGLLLGMDFALTPDFYLGIESTLFLNPLFQSDNSDIMNFLTKPFDFLVQDPLFQFGINATLMFPPPYLTNRPEAVKTDGVKITWNDMEYMPDFLSDHSKFLNDLKSLPDLPQDIRNEIEGYEAGRTAGYITSAVSGIAAIGFGSWATAGLVNGYFEPWAVYPAVCAGGFSIALLLILQATVVPDGVIDLYNRSIGGTK